jgi:cytochrome c oxidase assembly factor CtaG
LSGSRFTPRSTFFEFQTDPLLLIPLVGIGIAYLVGYRRYSRLRHADQGYRSRAAIFVTGYATLVIALISPLHALGEQYFWVHMIQHLLLSLVAAPLLLLSGSMPVLLWAFSPRDRQAIGRLVGRPGVIRLVLMWLTNPIVAWTVFVVTQWVWHQPVAYDWALENHWAHYLEHISFFVTAVFFWWPVIGAPPMRSPLSFPTRLAYTFLAWLPNSVLGAGITLSRAPLYPYYVGSGRVNGFDPLFDQQLAGLIMWVPGDVLFVIILMILFAAYLRDEERRAERLDRELDAAQLRT